MEHGQLPASSSEKREAGCRGAAEGEGGTERMSAEAPRRARHQEALAGERGRKQPSSPDGWKVH